jgi:glutamine synthetase
MAAHRHALSVNHPVLDMPFSIDPARLDPVTLPALPDGTEFIDAFIIDINGNTIGKRLPADHVGKMAEKGVQFSSAALILDNIGQGQNPVGLGGDDGDPDGTAMPVPWTLKEVPWAKVPTAQCLLNMVESSTGQPLWFDARGILKSVIARCAEDGVRPVVACELEFYLVDPVRDSSGRLQPPTNPTTGGADRQSRNLSLQQVEDYQQFLGAVVDACKRQGLHAGSLVSEYGLGQFEINLEHLDDPLRAADEASLLRRIVKGVAHAQGHEATFMSKPFLDRPGSGFHVHLSLVDETGRNRFGAEGGETLLRSTIAGYQALMRESMGFFAPNFSAYRRYAPRLFAPMNRHWGYNNRSVAFRVPAAGGSARRIEHRVSGADASPHLVMAALLAAAHHGVTHSLVPTEPVTGNVGGERDPAFPGDLFSALDALEHGALLAEYMPHRFLQLYAQLKRNEFADVTAQIMPCEYDYYL